MEKSGRQHCVGLSITSSVHWVYVYPYLSGSNTGSDTGELAFMMA